MGNPSFPYPCAKCDGTGQFRNFGHCRACGGRGGFKSSPEQREATKARRLALKKAGAQQENHNAGSVFLFAMNPAHGEPSLMRMRADHLRGRQWTPTQISNARQMLAMHCEAQRLLAGE